MSKNPIFGDYQLREAAYLKMSPTLALNAAIDRLTTAMGADQSSPKLEAWLMKTLQGALEHLQGALKAVKYKTEAVNRPQYGNLLKSLVNELAGLSQALDREGYEDSADHVSQARMIIQGALKRATKRGGA